jgi:GNAT superfamily N-acetyltransferase
VTDSRELVSSMADVEVRDARLPEDRVAVERLWLEYLTWGNDEMANRHGFRLPVREAVDRDLESIAKFQPPDGRIILACDSGRPFGIGCLRRVGVQTGEIKRMYVEPARRGAGVGRAILDRLLSAAGDAGYRRVVLDSPDFMTAAHALYRSRGFVGTEPYRESEIPDEFKSYWVFMAMPLASTP